MWTTTVFQPYIAHAWRLSALRSRHCTRDNYDAWKPCARWQGRAGREQSEECSLALQPKGTKEQRGGCADPPLGSVGERHECYVPRKKYQGRPGHRNDPKRWPATLQWTAGGHQSAYGRTNPVCVHVCEWVNSRTAAGQTWRDR